MDGDYSVASMEAYFDESGTHEGSPLVCVAGYLFEKGNAIALGAAGEGCLKKRGCPSFVCQIARTQPGHLKTG